MPVDPPVSPSHIWYEIRVSGELDTTWQDRFDRFEIRHTNGDTLLFGPITDQAALFALLMRIHGIGLKLLEVRRCSTAGG